MASLIARIWNVSKKNPLPSFVKTTWVKQGLNLLDGRPDYPCAVGIRDVQLVEELKGNAVDLAETVLGLFIFHALLIENNLAFARTGCLVHRKQTEPKDRYRQSGRSQRMSYGPVALYN